MLQWSSVRRLLVLAWLAMGAVPAARALPAAPAHPGSRWQAAPEPLQARAQQYWERRQAKDLGGAYPFYCQEYRDRVSRDDFLRMTRLTRFDLSDVKVLRADAAGDRAEVVIGYRFTLPRVPGELLEGRITDGWRRGADGQWCKDDEPLQLPFPATAPK